MKAIKKILIFITISTLTRAVVLATGAGTSSGLTLTEPQGARAAALGEAFTAAENDSSAMGYNPATLSTLKTNHVNLMYDKGLANDSYGQFIMGLPMEKTSFGISVGYYNGGSEQVCEQTDCSDLHSVTTQKDIQAGFSMAQKLGPVGVGLTGKYISSTLIGKYNANAYAADAGFIMPIGKFRVGGALQNFGSKMTYDTEGDNLPRIARVGFSVPMAGRMTLFADAPYLLNEKQLTPEAGLEFLAGPLALRAGYQNGSDLQNFSVGMGIVLGRMTLDYAFGFSKELDNVHRLSLGMRFGGETRQPVPVFTQVKPAGQKYNLGQTTAKPNVTNAVFFPQQKNRIYTVQPGDTLRSIAQKQYGRSDMWTVIRTANAHLLTDPDKLEVGQKLIIPASAD